MENGVNVPLDGEFQTTCNGGYDFCDFEGAVAPWSQFYCPIRKGKILPIKPNLLVYCPVWGRGSVFVCRVIEHLNCQNPIVPEFGCLFFRRAIVRQFTLFCRKWGFPSDEELIRCETCRR